MAFGASTVTDVGGAVSDLFAASADRSKAAGLRLKATGDELEGQNYGLASDLAEQNEKYTETSTAIKELQASRQINQTIGGQQADVAGAGFASGGSSYYLMADSAAQGNLTKSVIAKQGLITEAGYTEQATSYQNLQRASGIAVQEDNLAANAADSAASGADITALVKGAAAVGTLFT